ncbi:Bifunctional nitrilase/nitrile hydratase NIT4 [Linum perenne]
METTAESAEEQRRTPESQSATVAAVNPYNQIHIPEFCYPAILTLKRELRLENISDVVPWLLEQLRLQTDSVPTCSSPALNPEASLGGIFVPRTILPPREQQMRVTVAQASTVFFDTPATLEKAEQLISVAALNQSRVVVFPEAFIGGYPGFLFHESSLSSGSSGEEAKINDDDLKRCRDSAIDLPGPEFEKLAQMARKYGINVVMGVVERAGTKLFSTVIFLDSLGRHLGHHRKLSIKFPSEASVWSPAEIISPLPIYETSSAGKFGGLISSDNMHPLLRNGLYEKRIEIYCAPTAEANEAWKDSMTHIAMEGNCFVLSANQFVRLKDCRPKEGNDAVVSPGGSVIVSPSGKFLTQHKYHGEYALSADLELGEISSTNVEFGGVWTGLGPNHAGWTVDAASASTSYTLQSP